MARPKGSKNRPKDDTASKPKGRKAKEKPAETARTAATSGNAEFARPTKDQVIRLTKRLDTVATSADDIRSSKKDLLDKAIETQHFNRAALSAALAWRKRAKKDPEKFSVEFAHFLSYVDDLELDKLANDARGFDLEPPAEDAPAAEEGEQSPAPRLSVVPGPAAPDAEAAA